MKLLSKFAFLFFIAEAVCGYNVVQPSLVGNAKKEYSQSAVKVCINEEAF